MTPQSWIQGHPLKCEARAGNSGGASVDGTDDNRHLPRRRTVVQRPLAAGLRRSQCGGVVRVAGIPISEGGVMSPAMNPPLANSHFPPPLQGGHHLRACG